MSTWHLENVREVPPLLPNLELSAEHYSTYTYHNLTCLVFCDFCNLRKATNSSHGENT
jgi:hypothetical protein